MPAEPSSGVINKHSQIKTPARLEPRRTRTLAYNIVSLFGAAFDMPLMRPKRIPGVLGFKRKSEGGRRVGVGGVKKKKKINRKNMKYSVIK